MLVYVKCEKSKLKTTSKNLKPKKFSDLRFGFDILYLRFNI